MEKLIQVTLTAEDVLELLKNAGEVPHDHILDPEAKTPEPMTMMLKPDPQ